MHQMKNLSGERSESLENEIVTFDFCYLFESNQICLKDS